ncbi:uncharacterized protein, partial [Lepeophtheirus salmonis]|uniref:uncharacterized protein n=1 Tax=Lepeophtheirus salmonis TaxID=72036 RepID=UPI001AE476E0
MASEANSTIFSPDGRLLQVEYALKASAQGSNITFTINDNKVTLAREIKNLSPMIEPEDFLHPISENKYLVFSGLVPDFYVLKKAAVIISTNYKKRTSEEISTRELVAELSDFVQYGTLSGKRPYGVQILVIGIEEIPLCFIIESDGNFIEYFAGSIGRKKEDVISYMEKGEISPNSAYKAIFDVVQNDTKKIEAVEMFLGG